VFIDSHHPPFWYTDCITLSEVRRALHTGYHNTLKILEDEGIHVYRVPFGTRSRYFVNRDDVRALTIRHGSKIARDRRLARSAARTKGIPLAGRCPHCEKQGRQWRSGLNSAGKREVKCGHCKRFYTIGKRPPIQSTCVHCGGAARQWRQQVTSAGNLTIRCGLCKRHYTVKGNPDRAAAPQESVSTWRPLPRPSPDHFEW
jgi:hypothetical protein